MVLLRHVRDMGDTSSRGTL